MQNGSTVVRVTASVPRAVNETVTELARSKHHSKAAEIRQALAGHIKREREAIHELSPTEASHE